MVDFARTAQREKEVKDYLFCFRVLQAAAATFGFILAVSGDTDQMYAGFAFTALATLPELWDVNKIAEDSIRRLHHPTPQR